MTINPDTLSPMDLIGLLAGASFRAMTPRDYAAFGGAEDGTLICYCERNGMDVAILQNPVGGDYEGAVSFIGATEDGETWQIDLGATRII